MNLRFVSRGTLGFFEKLGSREFDSVEGGAEVIGVREGLELLDQLLVGRILHEPWSREMSEVAALVHGSGGGVAKGFGGGGESGEVDVGGEVLFARSVERMILFLVLEVGLQAAIAAGGVVEGFVVETVIDKYEKALVSREG